MNLILECKEFETNLLGRKQKNGDVQYLFKFDNNYGASVVKSWFSYGRENDEWELAVVQFDRYDDYDLVYDTEITSDVEGYLSDEEVLELLQKIKELK